MKTKVSTDRDAAVELLRKGEVVALPTETVYGLAADALNSLAVAKIFEAKERPRFDPLIVHLPDRDWLEKIAEPPAQDRQLISKLTEAFWPGPFTIVLPKRNIVPDIVTAGLETVAIRISSHPIFAEIIRAFGSPLAAPSANRFGRISPTTAEHVRHELEGSVPLIVDAGPTMHGIESTIVAIRAGQMELLRRGPIIEEQLTQFADVAFSTNKTVRAPGQFLSHYSPRTRLLFVSDPALFIPAQNERCGLLAWRHAAKRFSEVRVLSPRGDVREAAANLFRYLRELDQFELDLIVAEKVPAEGLGRAINDRLSRAAGPN